jgi:protein-disulfide isomerase
MNEMTPWQEQTGRLRQPLTDDDHALGPPEAPATLVEYGDFQCPYCGAAHLVLKELLRRRPQTVRLIFRHFPLTNVHPYAEIAAETSEAAAVRGAFWPLHDWLYSHQDKLDPPHLATGVDRVGLPVQEVGQELNTHRYRDRVHRDFVGGIRSGVNGTPSFFLNGVRHDGGYDLVTLISAVDAAASASVG